ncbi:hypothetical protein HPB52_008036 [Rhipicephalus sanguineus]|uniref:Cullin N-terminal domain-containing protein n=1 Tax=Rhipicephalus sanguineus TaxID=34632 RepID=A0A9D4T1H4_RHISA|nr:hypothetical protein HPB52_008036 [Rhipicephalus sanguineus]
MDNRRIEDHWLERRRGFNGIQEKKSTNQRFDDLYQAAYAMVARNEGEYSADLREAVTEHLTSKIRALVLATVDGNFLQALSYAWKDHHKSMRMISDIVKYLGLVAHYVDVQDRLRETMLDLVKSEREGESVDRASLKKACEILVVLGLDSESLCE